MMHFVAVGETSSSVSCSCRHSPSLLVDCYFLKFFKIAIANNVTAHCASAILMPPSMLLLVVANRLIVTLLLLWFVTVKTVPTTPVPLISSDSPDG